MNRTKSVRPIKRRVKYIYSAVDKFKNSKVYDGHVKQISSVSDYVGKFSPTTMTDFCASTTILSDNVSIIKSIGRINKSKTMVDRANHMIEERSYCSFAMHKKNIKPSKKKGRLSVGRRRS